MNGLVSQYALFLAEIATLVLAVFLLAVGLVALSRRKDKAAGRAKLREEQEDIHALFRAFVQGRRA